MFYSRRAFGRIALVSLPASALAAPNSRIKGVQIGAITYSFRQGVPKPDIIPGMAKIGLSEVELMSGDAEALAGMPAAAGGGGGRGRGGRAPLTPEQQAAMEARQKEIKDWRASTTPAKFQAVKQKFKNAGIELRILCFNMGRNIADGEIDYAFRMAKATGVKAISSSSTVTVAKRVAAFADKYKIIWAGHGHDNVSDPEEFAKPETFELIMSFCKNIGVNLDIGHFTAANYDPITFIQKHHSRIANLHLKDRKKNSPDGARGANVSWGGGDTPIKEVLLLMKKEKYTFPANIELEYPIPEGSDAMTEVAKCYQYAKTCLES